MFWKIKFSSNIKYQIIIDFTSLFRVLMRKQFTEFMNLQLISNPIQTLFVKNVQLLTHWNQNKKCNIQQYFIFYIVILNQIFTTIANCIVRSRGPWIVKFSEVIFKFQHYNFNFRDIRSLKLFKTWNYF